MKLIVQLTTSTAILVALSACGSSSSSSSSSTPTTRQFADTAGTASKALDDGATLTAQAGGSSALNLNYATGDTSLADASFALKKNADGELTFTVNGVEQAFTEADRSLFEGQVFGYQIADEENDKFVGLYSYFGTLDESLDTDNDRYLQIWGYQSNQINNGPPDLRGYAVVGTETRPDALAALPSATYLGRARIDSYDTTGFVQNNVSQTQVRSDLNMTANFGSGTISGQMTNFEVRGQDQPGVNIAGTISMDETSINGNGFSGTLTPDAALLAASQNSSLSGTYGGSFYGPEGEQVGGTLAISGMGDEGDSFVGAGFFEGWRD